MKLANPDFQRQIATLAAVLGSILINTLSNVFPLNGALVAISIRQANVPLIMVTGWVLALAKPP